MKKPLSLSCLNSNQPAQQKKLASGLKVKIKKMKPWTFKPNNKDADQTACLSRHKTGFLMRLKLYEPRREKTGFLHDMRKQRRRSASR